MMDLPTKITLAFLLDLLIGDPRWLPHPVRWIGRFALMLESPMRTIPNLRVAGVLAALTVIGTTILIPWLCIKTIELVHPLAANVVEIYLLYTCFACNDLLKHSRNVATPLKAENLHLARTHLQWMVGRDTDTLDEPEIVRATIESVSENLVDGITAPLFFATLGGPLGAIAYKAINTLDSTFGYKNARYLNFGWASAKIDDVANYLPARITAPLLAIIAMLHGHHGRNALRILIRDGRNHPSPNSGLSESVIAGALGIQLGGTNFYAGVPSHRPTLGDAVRPATTNDIFLTNRLILNTSLAFLGLSILTLMISFT